MNPTWQLITQLVIAVLGVARVLLERRRPPADDGQEAERPRPAVEQEVAKEGRAPHGPLRCSTPSYPTPSYSTLSYLTLSLTAELVALAL
jgi:hypothetical protein